MRGSTKGYICTAWCVAMCAANVALYVFVGHHWWNGAGIAFAAGCAFMCARWTRDVLAMERRWKR